MITKIEKKASYAVFALLLSLSGSPVSAFNFTPIDSTLRPAGSGATQTFSVENPSPAPVAVEISMHTREMTPAGEDVLASASELFTVYPSQLILQPGSRQSVRVQWTGPAELGQERAFRLIAEELPIQLGAEDDSGAGLDLLVRYVASVYVQPTGAEARLSIQPDRAGENLVLEVQNQGTRRAILRDEDYRILIDGETMALDEAQREAIAAINVLAGHTRRLTIPDSEDLVGREIQVQWLRSSD